MLALLNRLRDTARLDAFLADISAAGAYSQSDNAALVEALDRLPPARATELIERIIAGNAGAALGACGDLLARCAAGAPDAGHRVDCLPAARTLVEALPGDPARTPRPDWRRPRWSPASSSIC